MLCVPKIRFCNIDGEGRQGQVVRRRRRGAPWVQTDGSLSSIAHIIATGSCISKKLAISRKPSRLFEKRWRLDLFPTPRCALGSAPN
jgi:hypothetical protein